MLVKYHPILQVFARQKGERAERILRTLRTSRALRAFRALRTLRTEKADHTTQVVKPLTRKEWINADRIVMLILVIGVIIGAIIFS